MRMMAIKRTGLCGGALLGLALAGCNSFDEAPKGDPNAPRLVIPVDERPASTAAVTPPAISGGTLSVLSDGSFAIVSDPERDRISIVDLATLTLRSTIELQPGDEPGRSVEDSEKHVHVALRRGGAVVSIDPLAGSVLQRRAVCKAPRGIAFEPAAGLLHVACAEGKLVSLPATGGDAVRNVTLEPDLRDVLVRGGELWVTRFKSAEVLRVNSLGVVGKRVKIPQGQGLLSQPASSNNISPPLSKSVTLEPGTAWRALALAAGGAVIVHQDAVADEVEVSEPSPSGSAYGGGNDGSGCGGIVKNVVTSVSADGTTTSTLFSGAPLPVDVAVSPDQTWIAFAHAGSADLAAPRPSVVFPSQEGFGSSAGPFAGGNPAMGVTLLPLTSLQGSSSCEFSQFLAGVSDPVTAVAFASDGRLLAQTRDPAQLIVMDPGKDFAPVSVPLLGESRADTGHDLFHRDAGGGIACASCHPEGGEDGRTWKFVGTGERRTQALHVGLRDTAPFHWQGDLQNVGELMTAVFVGRMGGVRESASRVSALSEWLFSLPAPAPIREPGDEAALRGQALFRSTDVGCSSCHAGSKLTDNKTVAVDTVAALKLQVPSLVAVGYRAPFMHDGCAATLADRFDPKCGGNAHGNTAALTDAQRGDLVAYLESL